VGWINGYIKTTLAFWMDEEQFSFEQLAAFIALLTGPIYFLFKIEYGSGVPRIDPKGYLFVVVFIYVFLYYATGGIKWIHSAIFAKYVRLIMLQTVLSLLVISALTTLGIGFGQKVDCGLATVCSTCLLYLHTRRIHKDYDSIKVTGSSLSVLIVSFSLLYFLILPSTG